MNQMPLNLITKLPYSIKNFVRHRGVTEVFDGVMSLLADSAFHLIVIHGASRTGKTHLSIALADKAAEGGRYPRFLEGRGDTQGDVFADELGAAGFASLNEDIVYFVDDADIALDKPSNGALSCSGPFVSFVEEVRKKRGKICLFFSRDSNDISADDHVMSRVRAGAHFELASPARDEVREIIREISIQRGLKFDKRELSFIERRVGTDIPSVEQFLERLEHLTKSLGRPINFLALRDSI